MDNKQLDSLLFSLSTNLDYYKGKDTSEVVEVTKAIFTRTASIPEQEFCESLVEFLYRYAEPPFPGWWKEDQAEDSDDNRLELFINPDGLFEGGKIRPDVVLKKGQSYVIFEIDSFQYHSNQQQITADKIRERKIESLGHPVFRFSAKECLNGGGWSSAVEAYEILVKKGLVPPAKEHG